MILKRGTMLDATLIEAVSAPPKEDRPSNDPDARFTKRQGKSGSTFGYKAHVGVDEGSGLIRSVITTPANINDTTPADDLIRGDERAVWADAAYDTHARRARLKAEGRKPPHRAAAQQASPRATAQAQALQSPHRTTTGGGGDHLRHLQMPNEVDLIRYVGLDEGSSPSPARRHRLQHAPMGGHHRISRPRNTLSARPRHQSRQRHQKNCPH